MKDAHALLGQLAIVLGIVGAVWAIAAAITRRQTGLLFVASLVWVVIVVALAALLGIATAVSNGPPSDPLHIVYGVLALAVLPGAALLASGRPARQQGVFAAVAMTVLVILLFRLFQTGS